MVDVSGTSKRNVQDLQRHPGAKASLTRTLILQEITKYEQPPLKSCSELCVALKSLTIHYYGEDWGTYALNSTSWFEFTKELLHLSEKTKTC
jgi:hypothetical protein